MKNTLKYRIVFIPLFLYGGKGDETNHFQHRKYGNTNSKRLWIDSPGMGDKVIDWDLYRFALHDVP